MAASDKAFTGSIPQLYDHLLVPMIFTPCAHDLAQGIKAHQPRDLLEIAAGTGAVTTILSAELPAETQITATDLNEPMLMQARTHLAGETRIRWQQADALALPFADASFDIVVCQFGAMFFPDRVKAIPRRAACCAQVDASSSMSGTGLKRMSSPMWCIRRCSRSSPTTRHDS